MGIIIINAPVEVYHSIGMVKCYYGPLQQVYSIISTKISNIKFNLALQMFSKTINNLISSNKLVLTLLVFGIYPKMTKLDILFLSITQHAMAMKKIIDENRNCIISQKVNNIFNIYNELSIASIYDLPINLPVLVY